MGLHIAYWLCQSNEQAAARGPHGGDEQMGGPCLLLCSPSSKSVDVLAGALGQPRGGGSSWGCWAWRAITNTHWLPSELLLSRRAELKPLRVYGEQAEATEFPVPGVSSWAPPKKTPQEERPNQTLRCSLSRVCLGGGKGPGPSRLGATGWGGGQHRASQRLPPTGASPCITGFGRRPTPMQPTSGPLMPGYRMGRLSPRMISDGK